MKMLKTNWLIIAGWIVSWVVIFWINFSAELSLMMYFFAIPVLLLSTAIGAASVLEPSDNRGCGD
jgi:hypothetical protein